MDFVWTETINTIQQNQINLKAILAPTYTQLGSNEMIQEPLILVVFDDLSCNQSNNITNQFDSFQQIRDMSKENSQVRYQIQPRPSEPQKPKDCEICKTNCEEGQVAMIGEKKVYTCSECGSIWTDRRNWYRHYHNIHVNRLPDIECQDCETKCKREYKEIVLNSKKVYRCQLCTKTYPKFEYWNRHYHYYHLKHTRIHGCDICNRRYTCKSELDKHKITHVTSRDYRCEICDTTYKSNFNLEHHTRVVHALNRPLFKCDQCERTFLIEKTLKKHINRDHRGIRFACDQCVKVCTDECNLNRHKREAHDPNYVPKVYKCNFCGEEFTTKWKFGRHKLIHIPNPEFVCELCGKKCKSKSILHQHLMMHSGEKPFQCKICNKGFRQNAALRVHMVTHSGARSYACNVCPKRFTQRSPLIIHMRLHTGERPYPCTICTKRFVSKSVLESHKRSQHRTAPY